MSLLSSGIFFFLIFIKLANIYCQYLFIAKYLATRGIATGSTLSNLQQSEAFVLGLCLPNDYLMCVPPMDHKNCLRYM